MNEEENHNVFHTDHVEHDMNDGTEERTKQMHNSTNSNGDQIDTVIGNEKTEAEAEGIESTSKETTLNVAVETAGVTGEEHSDRSTVNEESHHTVSHDHHARCALQSNSGSIV